MKTAIFLIDNCFGSGVHAILDSLIAANYALIKSGDVPLFEWDLISLDGKPVTPTNGLSIIADYSLEEYSKHTEPADVWLIPAVFQSLTRADKIQHAIHNMQAIIPTIQQHHQKGGLVVSLCSGSFLLAEAGLLDGKAALMHWKSEPLFKKLYPHIKIKRDQMIIDYGNIISAIGGGVAYEYLVMHLVERYAGNKTAVDTAKLLMMNLNAPNPIPYRGIHYNKQSKDGLVECTKEYLQQHYQDDINFIKLSDRLKISERQLHRRFKASMQCSPHQYLQQVRIASACTKLENTQSSIQDIVYMIGYQDDSSFRRLFKRHMGMSMAAYRDHFGPQELQNL